MRFISGSPARRLGASTSPNGDDRSMLRPTPGIQRRYEEEECRPRVGLSEEVERLGYPGGYCTVPAGTAAVPVLWVLQMGTAGYWGYCAVPAVPVGTAGYCGYCGYCTG